VTDSSASTVVMPISAAAILALLANIDK